MGKCKECEFCFPDAKLEYVCAGSNYGESVIDTLEEEKDCYSEGFAAFSERMDQESIPITLWLKTLRLMDVKELN